MSDPMSTVMDILFPSDGPAVESRRRSTFVEPHPVRVELRRVVASPFERRIHAGVLVSEDDRCFWVQLPGDATPTRFPKRDRAGDAVWRKRVIS